MNKIKLEYEAPEVNTLEVKFEGSLLAISGGEEGRAGQDLTEGNIWSFDDDDD